MSKNVPESINFMSRTVNEANQESWNFNKFYMRFKEKGNDNSNNNKRRWWWWSKSNKSKIQSYDKKKELTEKSELSQKGTSEVNSNKKTDFLKRITSFRYIPSSSDKEKSVEDRANSRQVIVEERKPTKRKQDSKITLGQKIKNRLYQENNQRKREKRQEPRNGSISLATTIAECILDERSVLSSEESVLDCRPGHKRNDVRVGRKRERELFDMKRVVRELREKRMGPSEFLPRSHHGKWTRSQILKQKVMTFDREKWKKKNIQQHEHSEINDLPKQQNPVNMKYTVTPSNFITQRTKLPLSTNLTNILNTISNPKSANLVIDKLSHIKNDFMYLKTIF